MVRRIALCLCLCACDSAKTPEPEHAPELKTDVLDRAGRPATNAALIAPLEARAVRIAARERYNRADRASWPEFEAQLAGSLALYDGLDGNCGNQLLAGPNPTAGRYQAFAHVLADDRVYVNTAVGTCSFLGVELGVATSCGGRQLEDDVVDAAYSALAAGVTSGVSDGVPTDPSTRTGEFPYVRSP